MIQPLMISVNNYVKLFNYHLMTKYLFSLKFQWEKQFFKKSAVFTKLLCLLNILYFKSV